MAYMISETAFGRSSTWTTFNFEGVDEGIELGVELGPSLGTVLGVTEGATVGTNEGIVLGNAEG